MGLPDKIIGFILVTASVTIFLYYSVWVLVLPFLEPTASIIQLFPRKEYAILIPSTALVFILVVVGVFVGAVIVKESGKAKKK